MFHYKLPQSLITKTVITNDGQLRFEPPLYQQRYLAVLYIIEDYCWKLPLKKVVDFGCSDMKFLTYLRRSPGVEHILEVDIDYDTLESSKSFAKPLISDYLRKREKPLRVEILHGSITDGVEQLYDVDALVGIEIIEHLHKEVLEKVPANVFGFIQPKLAIFSTPNSEYNVFFQPLENGFRHPDHKFEWTRKEFETWALGICKSFPNYTVSFTGLGEPPQSSDHEKIGCATQIAIFIRNDMIGKPLSDEVIKKPITTEAQYNIVYTVDYPMNEDKRSMEETILDETSFYLSQLKQTTRYLDRDKSVYQIPWKHLLEYTQSVGGTESNLLEILKNNNYIIEGDFIILPEYDEDDFSDDLDCNGEYDLEAQPYKCRLTDELDEVSSHLASGCNLTDSEEDWN